MNLLSYVGSDKSLKDKVLMRAARLKNKGLLVINTPKIFTLFTRSPLLPAPICYLLFSLWRNPYVSPIWCDPFSRIHFRPHFKDFLEVWGLWQRMTYHCQILRDINKICNKVCDMMQGIRIVIVAKHRHWEGYSYQMFKLAAGWLILSLTRTYRPTVSCNVHLCLQTQNNNANVNGRTIDTKKFTSLNSPDTICCCTYHNITFVQLLGQLPFITWERLW